MNLVFIHINIWSKDMNSKMMDMVNEPNRKNRSFQKIKKKKVSPLKIINAIMITQTLQFNLYNMRKVLHTMIEKIQFSCNDLFVSMKNLFLFFV